MPATKSQRRARGDRLGRQAWIEAGRTALIAGGIERVKIEPLGAKLGVTTGSFYWHFPDRPALLAALIEDWEARNTAAMRVAVETHRARPLAALDALADVWIDARDYDPRWDAAVRDWARADKRAERAVRRVDNERIALLRSLYAALGDEPELAYIRARVTYFHQVGYYALRIVESRARRRALKPLYLRVLSGRAPR